jgi:hypothetical protein
VTAAFGLSAIAYDDVVWWSAALLPFVPTMLTVVVVAFALRWERTRAGRDLAGVAVAYLLACLFWEKAVLAAASLGFFLVIVVDGGLGVRARLRRLFERWPLWLTMAAIAIPYLVVFAISGYSREAGPPASASVVAEFVTVGWFRAFWPAMAGFSSRSFEVLGSGGLTVAVGQLLALVALVLCLRKGTPRVAAFFVLAFVFNVAVVGRARAAGFGTQLVLDLRYHADNLVLLAMAAGAHLAARPRGPQPRSSARVQAAVAAALAGSLIAAHFTGIATAEQYGGTKARQIFSTFRESARQRGPVTVLDRVVPTPIAIPQLYPYSLQSRALGLAGTDVRFARDVDAPGATFPIVDDHGAIREGSLDTRAELRGGTCTGPAGGDLRLDAAPTLPPDRWLLRLEATAMGGAAGSTAISVLTFVGGNQPREARVNNHTPIHEDTAIVTALAPGPIDGIMIRASGAVCIRGGALGLVR